MKMTFADESSSRVCVGVIVLQLWHEDSERKVGHVLLVHWVRIAHGFLIFSVGFVARHSLRRGPLLVPILRASSYLLAFPCPHSTGLPRACHPRPSSTGSLLRAGPPHLADLDGFVIGCASNYKANTPFIRRVDIIWPVDTCSMYDSADPITTLFRSTTTALADAHASEAHVQQLHAALPASLKELRFPISRHPDGTFMCGRQFHRLLRSRSRDACPP